MKAWAPLPDAWNLAVSTVGMRGPAARPSKSKDSGTSMSRISQLMFNASVSSRPRLPQPHLAHMFPLPRLSFNRGPSEPELALGSYALDLGSPGMGTAAGPKALCCSHVLTGAGRAHRSRHPQPPDTERKQARGHLPVLASVASLPVPLLQGLVQSEVLYGAVS